MENLITRGLKKKSLKLYVAIKKDVSVRNNILKSVHLVDLFSELKCTIISFDSIKKYFGIHETLIDLILNPKFSIRVFFPFGSTCKTCYSNAYL